jgi:excisionase family DNA binding protein
MEEGCRYLGVNRNTLLGMIHEGKIPASKLRFRWRMKRSDIDYYIRHGQSPLQVEREREQLKGREEELRERKESPARKEFLDPEKLERLKNSSRPKRTLTTALLLRNAISILSENPCYLVGPESQTFLNTHLQDNGLECDLIARGALCGVLSRSAELFLSEELPPPSHRRQVLTLLAQLKSIEVVEEHLSRAIAEVGLSPFDSSLFMSCAGELVQNAVEAVGDGGKEFRVIIEAGRDDLLFTVINQGHVEELPGRMPDPDSPRGRGIGMSKQYVDDFLFLSTNDQVIVTVRKAKGARREAPQGH